MKRVEEDENSIENLEQLVRSLEEIEAKIETSYKNEDFDLFNKSKHIMLQVNNQILEITK